MVRETRHLWIGNLPENIREERIREHFKRYGRVQSVKLLPGSNGSLCAAVAFMDIKSASKAHNCEHTLDEHALSTEYYEPGPYTSSQQRFPIGITDDHSAFERTSHFYERGASAPSTPLSATGTRAEMDGYLRRSSMYHAPPDSLRGRPRDRPYRNGPSYPAGTERSACSNNRRNWVYDTGTVRYLNSTDEHGTGKSKKVRSGSESRSGSHSSRSRSPTRSTTGSPHSSDSSTLSESPRSTGVTVQSTVAPPVQQTSSTLAVYSEDRRPLAICVRNLPTRSSDTSLKDGLFHEYKKHGKVTWVKVVGTANERYALVCFKKPEDVEKAIEVSQDKLFFGCKIDVVPYHGYDVEDNEARPYDTELDEFHPKATRTLFIGNLEKDVTAGDLRQHFDQFGEIIEIDIKKQPGVTSSYAFCQYADIGSVVQAMRTLDGEPLGEARLKLGFGKSMASSCVWIAGVAEQVSDKYLDLQFRKFGPVSHVVVDRDRGQALIFYEQVSAAAAAVKEMRGVPLRGNRIQIDFASRECQQAFYERIDTQGRDNNWSSFETSRSERDILCSRFESSRFRYEPSRVRSSSYSRSSSGRTPRRHEVYESPRYKSYEELSPTSDHDDFTSNETPDLRHLHKERNHLQHLLDQLDRPLRSVKAADQGLVVTTHNHRRRLSSHQRSSGEGPAPLCKRRKTGSTSEDERKKHHHHHSGDESRPGTPLFDEKPDNNHPQEPRRVPRERPEEPLCLPLPQFAAHCFSNLKSGSTSTILSNSVTVQQAPPASPVRPPSPSSTTSSSDLSPQSPTLEERIRSLDEKYEKWTGRTLQPPTKPKHRLLDVDVRELQPSDIVKSVLAKPSVFDDDSKRLENFGEKYEPRDFSSYPRSVGLEVQRFVPGDPRNPSYLSNLSVKVSPVNSPSGMLLSPCPAAKGLQYPFPSHPPVQPTTSVATTTAGSSPPPTSVARPISKSVEFSVQKAESWLGITKNSEPSTQKDSLISGGFSQRFSAYSKVGDVASQRQNVIKPTDIITLKIDIPAQKSMDPRIEKANSLTTTTSVLSQRIAVKSSDPMEIIKNDVNSQKLSAMGISNNINNTVSNVSITKIGNSSGHFNINNSSCNNSSINKNPNNNNENKSTNNTVNICKNNSNGVKEVINTSSIVKSGKEEEMNGSKNDIDLINTNRVNSVSKTDEILSKSLDCSLAYSKSLKSEIMSNENNSEKKDDLISSETSVSLSKESRITCKSNTESENSNIFSSDKFSVDSKDKAEGILQNCESTKKLESSLLKSNVSHNKTSDVILADLEGKPLKTVGQNLVKSDANGSSTKTGDSSSSKISEISGKLLDDSDKDKHLHLKSALISKNEFMSEIDSGTEYSDKLVKPLVKEKDKVLFGKDEKNGKDVEKDKNKDKVIEREKERDRSLVREKQKDREILENVDKERKKDREVEFERKKDRESMEVIEREKKKENDLEGDRKKDQSDVLDRRKESSDKKLQDPERLRKKEEQKEKRKERDSLEKKKDWLSSEKHKKSSTEEKKKENEYETKKKDKGERPSSIGSKRRVSSQDSLENIMEEVKRPKMDHKRRDSKDNRNAANTNLGNSSNTNKVTKPEQKCQETKSFMDSKCKTSDLLTSQKAMLQDKIQDLKRKDDSEKKKSLEAVEKKKDMKKIQIKLEDVLKNVSDYNGKNNKEGDKIFSEALEEKKCQLRKESKDKEKKKILKQEFGSNESLEDKKIQKKEKRVFVEKKKDEEGSDGRQSKEKNRNDIKKENGHETETDSDSEPTKKHSIFDVVLDEPAYISMYDKVKARSCKNMQKQEEVKKQVKLKEKFSQLKQSRAKREEKKRSTSWDEDSDSDTSQIRRIPRRSFSRLSSEDESNNKREKKISECWDSENKRLKKSYDTSEDEGIKFRPTIHKTDIYSEDSDAEFPDNEKMSKKISSKFKSKNIFEPLDEDNLKKSVDVAKENFQSTPKPEKIIADNKNKVRLSLDSSTDRFCYENKKLNLGESMSEGEPSYLSSTKGIEKMERKKSKKRDKRQKSVDNDSKVLEGESVFTMKAEIFLSSNKSDKQERRKSVHSGSENHDDNSMNKKKNRCLKETFECNAISKLEDNNSEEVFNDFLEDSNDHLSVAKVDPTIPKSNASKWNVAQVYGTDSDSNVDAVELMSVGKLRKSKEKRKRDKKIREPSEELLKAGKALEKILTSPSCRRDSEEKQCNDNLEDLGEEKLKVNKEKKKKRKKSKDEKSSRHHHHHHHHHHGFTEKIDCGVSSTDCRAGIKSPTIITQSSPSLPSLLEMPNNSLDIKQESTLLTPEKVQNSKSCEKIMPGFGYEIDEKIHETAVQSIALLEVAKVKAKTEVKEAVEEPEEKKEDSKERTVISQEETEDAVAALLGETFSYSSCFERNSPLETDPGPHDEEEMRQAVQSLKEGKPDTPQSESGLQIDTDVEESDEHLGGMRFESLPRTPDLDLSQPPKTPDIQQSYVIKTKQPIAFPRKDTTRNSREEMEVPIVDPASPDSMVPYKNVEIEMKDKDVDLMPPILKPASPKLYKDEPPIIEPISSLNSSDRIYVDNRLLLHPPPLVPVAKSITVTKSSPGLSLVRPKTSLNSNNTPPTLVLTSIRTTTALGAPHSNSQISRKPYIVSTTSSNISTSRSSVPPILSPVTASLSTPVLLSSTCSESSNLSISPRFTTSSTIVSSQQIPSHLISQKIILHQVPRVTPTRLIPAQSAVVKVVDPLNVQKSSSNEMPTLTLPELVNTNPSSMKTLSTPPPSLGPVLCQGLPSTSSAASVNVTQTESTKTASVISILPRSLPVTISSQEYSRFTSITSGVNASMIPNIPTSLVSCSGNTSVISVHSNSLDTENSISDNQHFIHQNVLSTSKVSSFAPLQKTMEYEKLLVPDLNTSELVKVKLTNSPKQSYTIENDNLDLPNSKTDNLEIAEKEKLDEQNRDSFKQEIIEQLEDSLENKRRQMNSYEEQFNKNDYNALKNNSTCFGEGNESVIKKINSVSDFKNEENTLKENAETCEKLDTSSLINQDDSSRLISSEEDNKETNGTTTRKGRKKVNRGGINSKKGRNGSENKPCTSSRRRGVKLQSKSSSNPGKKQSKDIYEFHDESDEDGSGEKDRPRLILTIKSPNSVKDQPVAGPKSCSSACKSPNSISKSPKDSGGPVKSPELKSPSIEKDLGIINTRKSKRLLEKDGYRNTVDDIIEDVVKNGAHKKATSPRRSLRQVTKISPALSNKKVAPRASKKLAVSSFIENDIKKEGINNLAEDSDPPFSEKSSALSISKPIKEEQEPEAETSDEESMTLIDPVTGMLMVMRAKEEGKYVPVANVPPVAPPTPPPPPAKTESLPMVTEGLASHWLTQETLKQAVIKVQTYEGNKINPVYMNHPPTPPTTPQNRVQDSTTRLPLDIKKKVIAEQFFESESSKSVTDMNKIILQPLTKQKICHVDAGKIYSDVNRGEYVETNRNSASEPGKIIRQISKIQPLASANKNLCSKGVAISSSPNKLYQNPKYVKMPPQNQILTGAVASSPPRVVKTTPPAHELHPMTGAVASPPPRAPHLTSQQPVVTGASSSRALVDPLKGPGASPRGMTIPPYEATMQSPTQNLQSPPPAHQQGEGINMGRLAHSPFVHPQLMYQQYLRAQEMLPSPYQLTASLQGKLEERERERGAGDMGRSPPLELRNQRTTDSPTVYMNRQQYTRYYDEPPPAHLHAGRHIHQTSDAPGQPRLQIATPPHASQVPPQADSLLILLQRYPIMWQGLLALKNDQSAVQMHFVFGNPHVARDSLPCNSDGSTPPLRIAQRMRLEQTQLEGVARKMQMDNEHCMLLALPCGRDHMDVLQQSTNLQTGFITYLQQKQAAGIVNIAHPGSQQAAYVVHIFPSCEFANENLARNAPDLLHRMQEIPHLVIVIATV